MSRARKQWLEWFRVDRDIFDHPKTRTLATLTGLTPDATVGLIVRMWCWVARYAPEGRLNGGQAEALAAVMTPPGCPFDGALEAFIVVGFLRRDPDGSGVIVHDWFEMNGTQLREREYDRRRKSDDTSIPAGTRPELGRNSNGVPSPTETVTVRRQTTPTLPNTSSAEPALPLGVPGFPGVQEPGGCIVARLPTVAPRGFYPVPEAVVAAWEEAFPGVPVKQALREMIAWLQANPARQKTARGTPRFIVAWLAREQNRSRPRDAKSNHRSGTAARYAEVNEIGE